MASLRAPGLGPIVGHTTDTTCRIWIRAGDPADERAELDKNRRTIGVIGIVREGKNAKIGDAWYFRLHREFDRTGTFMLGSDRQLGWYEEDFKEQGKPEPANLPKGIVSESLKPDTEYVVRLGTLTLDDPAAVDETVPNWVVRDRLPDINKIKDELLTFDASECEARFHTFPRSGQIAGQLSFILGSCRYPAWWDWTNKEADRIFAPVAKHFEPGNQQDAARFIMMCGDQVYADTLNKSIPALRADTYAEFQERYTTAFGTPNMRRLLRMAPAYMTLDDHEIEDNWTQDRLHKGGHQLFNLAVRAYLSYQWSHGPRTWGRLLYYNFVCAGYPLFVLDVRTHRYKDELVGLSDNHLLGRPSLDLANHPSQLDRLLMWLSKQQKDVGDAPKFIVAASVFVPNAMDERVQTVAGDNPPPNLPGEEIYRANVKRREASDSWPAYPNTRLAILERIVTEKIQNVVFLGGDIHCSCVAEIEFDGAAKDLKAFCITSSAFYWPWDFADGDPNGYVHDSRRPEQFDPFPVGTNTVMHYRSYGYTQEDNFTRVDIDRATNTITVRTFDTKGNAIKVSNRAGKTTEKGNVLQLAKW